MAAALLALMPASLLAGCGGGDDKDSAEAGGGATPSTTAKAEPAAASAGAGSAADDLQKAIDATLKTDSTHIDAVITIQTSEIKVAIDIEDPDGLHMEVTGFDGKTGVITQKGTTAYASPDKDAGQFSKFELPSSGSSADDSLTAVTDLFGKISDVERTPTGFAYKTEPGQLGSAADIKATVVDGRLTALDLETAGGQLPLKVALDFKVPTTPVEIKAPTGQVKDGGSVASLGEILCKGGVAAPGVAGCPAK
jgi:hypothetical protein